MPIGIQMAKFMDRDIIIEAICVGHPDYLYQEFIALANISTKRIHLSGWRLVWTELPTGRELHFDVFNFSEDYFFDPGEKLFLVSGIGDGQFYGERQHSHCPMPHWLVYTGSRKHICSVPHVKVSLYDANGIEIDNRYSRQGRYDQNTRPAIVIGHGRDPVWRDVKDYLHDQLGFEVEAFETGPHSSQTIPDVIASLGDKSNMAILVLTGEDKTDDGNTRARQNVIHELGKFQERFGNNKTIVLVEKGTELPSNISGLIRIDFEPDQIKSTFGDIIAVINREFTLW